MVISQDATSDVPIELRMRANVFVKDLFAGYGQILSCKVVQNEEGKSLGYGYLQFASAEAASTAIASKPRAGSRQELSVQRFVPKNERDKRRPGYTNVYVRNLPKSVTNEEDLLALFHGFGEVSSAFLAKDDDACLKGFGFVNFSSHEAARKAVNSMNEKKVCNRKLFVAAAQTKEERARILAGWVAEQDRPKGQPPTSGETIIVKNLPYNTNGKDLRELFQDFGKIYLTKIAVMHDGKSRGFGFVHFETSESAHDAIQSMHLTMVGGRRISVTITARKGLAGIPGSPTNSASTGTSVSAVHLPVPPPFQYQQMCYPAYQYPIPSQGMPTPIPMQNSFLNVPMGYMSRHSPDEMGVRPNTRPFVQSEDRGNVHQHGTGGSWNQPYFWPPTTGAGHFSNILGHGPSNPYGMMAPGMHAMLGSIAPVGH